MYRSIIYIMALFFLFYSGASAELYMWTDENGVKHCSDQPPPEPAEDLDTLHETKHDDSYYEQPGRNDADYWIQQGEKRRREKAYKEKLWEIEQNSKKRADEYDDRIRQHKIDAAQSRVDMLESRLKRYKQYERDSDYFDSAWHEDARQVKKELEEAKRALRDLE